MGQAAISQQADQSKTGSFSKLFSVIINPVAVFRSLAERPRILAPFLAYLILSIPAGILLSRKIDWTTYYRRQLAQDVLSPSTAAHSQDEVIAARVARVHKLEPYIYVVGAGVVIIATSFFYWLAFNTILGAGISFRKTLSIICYALVPIMLALCYAIISLAFRPDASLDQQRVIPTNLAYYLPIPSAPWLVELGNSVELAWIWTLVLVSIGVRTGASRRVSNTAAYGVVFGLWFVWVLAKVGWAGLFGV